MIRDDFHVDISESTMSRYLVGKLYTVKETRVEPVTCNSEINLEKRRLFAEALIKHQEQGDLIVYLITQRMVQKMELHAAKFVNAATRSEAMVYGK
ncbi:hypothetical protein PHYSODRAFT_285949 [Phytophthora sojae]|uniref:Uncharacterized protein n=1 Tax=Phytophthora sojae (strain P6497) TaxID=1094619 RepID=G4ZGR2_PHYSP|nr:hypothetical protein PHYSODRAFT_285949 [Phytophthora sojae]EGZ17561.1 hypothetical protein PHYSODRAFT_285949 [Phytophthora sojae]|eukprot:XP_009526619.1 hypothetical protein PHYSODRAFT_285949 [Phytophthora sojae]